MKRILLFWLVTLIVSAPLSSAARTMRYQSVQGAELSSITFTFNAPCEGCSTQNSEAGDNRYLIEVPTGNTPSLAKSGPDLNMEIRLRDDRQVYAIAFKPGTSPRAVWRNGGRVLQVFFVPPEPQHTINKTTTAPQVPRRIEGTAPEESTNNTNGTSSATIPVRSLPDGSTTRSAITTAATQPGAAPQLAELSQPVNVDEKGSTALAAVDMSVPESPAFTVLGVTPQTVTRPTSPRAFASSLLNGVDTNGNFQSGLALDFVPYLLLAGDQLTLRNYQTRYITRMLARTQFSFGTTKGATEDDKSLRLALGLHLTLWDKGDPRTDGELIQCLGRMKTPRRPEQLEPELLGTTPADVAEFNRRVTLFAEDRVRYERDKQAAIEFNNDVSTRCREESHKRNWNSSSWTIAAAPSWISQDGQTKHFNWNGGGFWTSLAYGFEGVPGLEDRSQLIVHARYRSREQTPDPNTTGEFLTQDTMFFGARFRHGSPTFNGSFEYTFLRSRPIGLIWDTSSRLSLGLERKIIGDTWFNLSLGGESGRTDGKNNGFVITSFKWAFSDRKDVSSPAIQ